jgi:hypothetical protein
VIGAQPRVGGLLLADGGTWSVSSGHNHEEEQPCAIMPDWMYRWKALNFPVPIDPVQRITHSGTSVSIGRPFFCRMIGAHA